MTNTPNYRFTGERPSNWEVIVFRIAYVFGLLVCFGAIADMLKR